MASRLEVAGAAVVMHWCRFQSVDGETWQGMQRIRRASIRVSARKYGQRKHSLMNTTGKLVTVGEEKAEVPKTFSSQSSGNLTSHTSQVDGLGDWATGEVNSFPLQEIRFVIT